MVKNRAFGQVMEEGDNPAFFKIIRREELSSELMRMIPHHLIRSISGKSSSFKMVLKVPWGSSWPVKISKNPIFHYMEDRGWNQFVNDNGLGENEYLTFTHEANMCFNVNIYEADGKEMLRPRKSPTIASSSSRNKREERKSIYIDVKKGEEIESWSESSYPGLETAESTSGRVKQKQELNLRKKEAGETEKSKKRNVDTVGNDSEARTSSLVPEFTLNIKKSHLLFLGIPKKFVDMHMPDETTRFKIHHAKGKKSWEVTYLVTDVQSRFSAGWSRLAKELGLVVGDVCTFKLIKPTEMRVKVSKEQTP